MTDAAGMQQLQPGSGCSAGQRMAGLAESRHDGCRPGAEGRAAAGIGGPVGRPKRKWFRRTVERLTRVVRAAGPAAEQASEALRGQRAIAIRSWLKAGDVAPGPAVPTGVNGLPAG
jgi:hypothetical protein